jgi:hypothetical protein
MACLVGFMYDVNVCYSYLMTEAKNVSRFFYSLVVAMLLKYSGSSLKTFVVSNIISFIEFSLYTSPGPGLCIINGCL